MTGLMISIAMPLLSFHYIF